MTESGVTGPADLDSAARLSFRPSRTDEDIAGPMLFVLRADEDIGPYKCAAP